MTAPGLGLVFFLDEQGLLDEHPLSDEFRKKHIVEIFDLDVLQEKCAGKMLPL